jgi:hypothetical protein
MINSQDVADKAHGWFRTWFAKVWKVRGGGLYAVGFAARFIFLEVRTVVSEIAESSSVGEFLSEQLMEFVFRFAMTSIMNTVEALIWPVYVIELSPPFGAIGLGIAFLVFTNYLKKPIERWLFPEDDLP